MSLKRARGRRLQISATRGAGCDILLGADRHLIKAASDEGINAIDVEAEPEEALKLLSS
ncbi:MAG: hypothetical protein NWF12_03400 [Candidatus Bathyarchaeota archaeon]|jgi:hypothetical protein|nr:hypothetical protein [Candidatus Bathyarchaeota archaeon]